MTTLRTRTGLLTAVLLVGWSTGTFTARGQAQAVRDRPLFTSTSELVLLNVSVRDGRRRFVSDLTSDAFTVYENGRPQPVRFFLSEDAPVTIGLLIDTSGSMLSLQSLVVSAVSAFANTANPLDEFFALTFDDVVRPVLPTAVGFTRVPAVLTRALRAVLNPMGRTSLYDAIGEGAAYAEHGIYQRKAIVVVTDGADNASITPFSAVLRQVQASNVVVYAVRLVDPAEGTPDTRELKALAAATGGELLTAGRSEQVVKAFQQVANAIRHAYVLAYEPNEPAPAGLHAIRVTAGLPGRGRLIAQTRSGYWPEGSGQPTRDLPP